MVCAAGILSAGTGIATGRGSASTGFTPSTLKALLGRLGGARDASIGVADPASGAIVVGF